MPNSENLKNLMEPFCKKDSSGAVVNETLCRSGLMIYPAVLVDINTKSETDPSLLETGVLVNKFTARMIMGEAARLAQQGLAYDAQDATSRDLYLQAVREKPKLIYDYHQTYPDDDLGQYYLAHVIWKKGQFKKAKNLIKTLVENFPEESRYKKTLDNINKKDPFPFFI